MLKNNFPEKKRISITLALEVSESLIFDMKSRYLEKPSFKNLARIDLMGEGGGRQIRCKKQSSQKTKGKQHNMHEK